MITRQIHDMYYIKDESAEYFWVIDPNEKMIKALYLIGKTIPEKLVLDLSKIADSKNKPSSQPYRFAKNWDEQIKGIKEITLELQGDKPIMLNLFPEEFIKQKTVNLILPEDVTLKTFKEHVTESDFYGISAIYDNDFPPVAVKKETRSLWWNWSECFYDDCLDEDDMLRAGCKLKVVNKSCENQAQ